MSEKKDTSSRRTLGGPELHLPSFMKRKPKDEDAKPKDEDAKPKDEDAKPKEKASSSRRTLGGPQVKVPAFMKRKSKDEDAKPKKATSSRPTLGGPEIKMPSFSSIKLPPPVAAAVADLRERGLLPIALLLVVAIVAVPFLLSSGSEPPPAKSGKQASATEVAIATAPETQPVVLKAGEGVREFKKRLDEAASKDPFKQQYAAPEAPAGDSTGGAAGDTGGGTATGGSTDTGTGGGGASTDGNGKPTAPGSLRFFHYDIDAYTGESGHLKLHHGISAADPIPNQATPVAIFIGLTDHAKEAIFSVSSQVIAVDGDINCPLSDNCSVIQLAPGKTAKFQYAPNGKTYAIKFVRAKLVVGKKP